MSFPILIVDDNFEAANLMAKLLGACGYQADAVSDGQTALERLKQKTYRIAIIDYRMPVMNGVELFRRMREEYPDIAGIFLTGYTTIDVVFPAIDAGILRVLSKPVDLQVLLPIIEEHRANHSARAGT